jgi:hypothetical protein
VEALRTFPQHPPLDLQRRIQRPPPTNLPLKEHQHQHPLVLLKLLGLKHQHGRALYNHLRQNPVAGASLTGNISSMVTLFHACTTRGAGARVGIAMTAKSSLGTITTVQIHPHCQSQHKGPSAPSVITMGKRTTTARS